MAMAGGQATLAPSLNLSHDYIYVVITSINNNFFNKGRYIVDKAKCRSLPKVNRVRLSCDLKF